MVIHYPITKRILNKSFWFCLGFFGFFLSIFIQSKEIWVLYDKIWFHSIIPFFVASIIFATYESAFRYTKGLRFLSYFSYNWYLWHPILVYFIYDHIGNNGKGFLVYLLVSFTLAVIFTKWIEEPFLKIRRKYIDGKIENISK
jgi:peptidoglycan/LPS O-acetylase OafA/YrhL